MSNGGYTPHTKGTVPVGLVLGLARGVTNLLDGSGRIVVTACLAWMFVALRVNVVLRYAFGSGIPRASEIHAILLPWLVAGGLAVASARGRATSRSRFCLASCREGRS